MLIVDIAITIALISEEGPILIQWAGTGSVQLVRIRHAIWW